MGKKVSNESSTSVGFLRMDETGQWVFGAEQNEVPKGTEFVVDPAGFQHGFVCWADPKGTAKGKLGEVIVSVTDPLPETGPVPAGGRGWEFLLGMHLRALDGDMNDMEMVYRTSSVGGKRAIGNLAKSIHDKLNERDRKREIVPVVTLDSDSQKHSNKAHGKIYVPKIEIQGWMATPKEGAQAASRTRGAQLKF